MIDVSVQFIRICDLCKKEEIVSFKTSYFDGVEYPKIMNPGSWKSGYQRVLCPECFKKYEETIKSIGIQ